MDIILDGLALVGLAVLILGALLYWSPQLLEAVAVRALSRRAGILAAEAAHAWIGERVRLSVSIEPGQPKPEGQSTPQKGI